jgi:hypothetical protein
MQLEQKTRFGDAAPSGQSEPGRKDEGTKALTANIAGRARPVFDEHRQPGNSALIKTT